MSVAKTSGSKSRAETQDIEKPKLKNYLDPYVPENTKKILNPSRHMKSGNELKTN